MAPVQPITHSVNMTSLEKNIQEILKNNDRTFGYKLDEHTAKSKLLKGVQREPFKVTHKQKCSNLDFNPGSFKLTSDPLVNIWENCSKNGELFEIGDSSMNVTEFKKGFDENGKHVDTKIVLLDESVKLTIHVYNSTQKINIAGKNSKEFTEKYLQPYFTNQVTSFKDDIVEFNKVVTESLSSKNQKVKRANVKFKAGTISACNRCDFSCKSNFQLLKHKNTAHTNSFHAKNSDQVKNKALKGPKHSTCDNSLIEEVLPKESSIAAIDFEKDIEINTEEKSEETVKVNNVEGLDDKCIAEKDDKQTNKISDDKSEGIKFDSNINLDVINLDDLENDFECDNCVITFRSTKLLNEHKRISHEEKCNYCDEVFVNTPLLNAHVSLTHMTHKCEICGNCFSNSEDLNEHTNLHLMNECMTPAEAIEHMKIGNCKELLFICGECGKSFETKRECITHMNKHESCYLNSDPVPVFPCDDCNEIYVTKQALEDHKTQKQKIHNANNDFVQIESSLNLLYKNVDTSLQNLNEKFDWSLNKVEDIVRDQNKVISELTEKVKFLTSVINKEQQINTSPKGPSQNNTKSAKAQNNTKSAKPEKGKMLIVGSSLNRNLHQQVIKNVTNCDVVFSEAFTVDRDMKSRDPNKNFAEVVPRELAKEKFDVLVMNSGPNEISNLNLKDDYNTNIDYWRQQVFLSSKHTFDLAINSIKNNPNLRKVVIVKRPTRFDSKIAANLSEFGNSVYDDLWMRYNCPRQIVVTKMDVECEGADMFQSYGTPGSTGFDGIHLRGPQAVQYMTRAFVKMLTNNFPLLKSQSSAPSQINQKN